jgi:general secretion pathway protein G
MIHHSHPRRQPGRSGFSLLELLAVVTIMGILVVIAVPRVSLHASRAKIESNKQYKGDLNAAVERYYFETGAFPSDLSVLANTEYYPADIPNCPVDNTEYVIDATSHRVSGHDH